jgi:hypothetical protein
MKQINVIIKSCSECPFFQWDSKVEAYYCRNSKRFFMGIEYQKVPGKMGFWCEQIVVDWCELENVEG